MKETDRQTDRQREPERERQTDRQTDRDYVSTCLTPLTDVIDRHQQEDRNRSNDSVHGQVSQRLKRLYPGRILTARYEDLAQKPLEFSARLLDFAGLDMDSKLRHYVWNITSSGGSVAKEQMWKTQRNNSSQTAGQWRQNSDFRFVAEVDKTCAQLYKLMGYLPFANEKDLRNLQLPYFRDLKQVPGLWTP